MAEKSHFECPDCGCDEFEFSEETRVSVFGFVDDNGEFTAWDEHWREARWRSSGVMCAGCSRFYAFAGSYGGEVK